MGCLPHRWAHDEEVVDSLYLQAAATQYRASAEAVGVPLPLYLLQLSVEMLLQGGQQYQAVQLLSSQPGMGVGLLGHPSGTHHSSNTSYTGAGGVEGGRGGSGSSGSALAAQLALDVSARQACMGARQQASGPNPASGTSSSFAPHVRALLAAGQVLQAARLARAHNIVSVPPTEFLEAAARASDAWAFAAVYRAWHTSIRSRFPTLAAAREHFEAHVCAGGAAYGNGALAANMQPSSHALQASA